MAINLCGQSRPTLQRLMAELGASPTQSRNLFKSLYYEGRTSFQDLPLHPLIKNRLAQKAVLQRPRILQQQTAQDGTIKFLLGLEDGMSVETVYIPTAGQNRGTLCVSSQIGCLLHCSFCLTGTQLFVRNLSAAEIVSQLLVVRDVLSEWPTPQQNRKISTIVFMGMGEPLFNLEAVLEAIDIFSDSGGLAISRRQITVSTSGIVPQIPLLSAAGPITLAVSLHAPTDALRTLLMPHNKHYPLADLLQALRNLSTLSNANRLLIEYVLFKDINDQPSHAYALLDLLAELPVKFNLIPFNPWPTAPAHLHPSPPETMKAFSDILYRAGFTATIRAARGGEIFAACGQLRSSSQRVPRWQQRLIP